MFIGKMNEEKKVLCFEIDSLDWLNIEDKICEYYGLSEREGCCITPITPNIYCANFFSAQKNLECEIGILNQLDGILLITVYPSALLRQLKEERESKELQRYQENDIKTLTLSRFNKRV